MNYKYTPSCVALSFICIVAVSIGWCTFDKRDKDKDVETRREVARICNGLYREYHLIIGTDIPGHAPVPYHVEDVTMTNWEMLYSRASQGKGPSDDVSLGGIDDVDLSITIALEDRDDINIELDFDPNEGVVRCKGAHSAEEVLKAVMYMFNTCYRYNEDVAILDAEMVFEEAIDPNIPTPTCDEPNETVAGDQ